MAACLSVLKDFVAANQAICVELKGLAVGFGPEHEGRVAEGSPRDGDGPIRHLVLYYAMLR